MKFKIVASVFILVVLIVVAAIMHGSGSQPSGEEGSVVPTETQ